MSHLNNHDFTRALNALDHLHAIAESDHAAIYLHSSQDAIVVLRQPMSISSPSPYLTAGRIRVVCEFHNVSGKAFTASLEMSSMNRFILLHSDAEHYSAVRVADHVSVSLRSHSKHVAQLDFRIDPILSTTEWLRFGNDFRFHVALDGTDVFLIHNDADLMAVCNEIESRVSCTVVTDRYEGDVLIYHQARDSGIVFYMDGPSGRMFSAIAPGKSLTLETFETAGEQTEVRSNQIIPRERCVNLVRRYLLTGSIDGLGFE